MSFDYPRPYADLDRLELRHPDYTVLVEAFAFGQFRIRLTDKTKPDPYALSGHGSIVREMCTYHLATAESTVAALAEADDPPAFCRALERPWNCEYERGRIRLDNVEGDLDTWKGPVDAP